MNALPLSPVAKRFAWKEYPTLRGMWFGVLGIGMLTQWSAAASTAAPGTDVPAALFGLALGATDAYAIGAQAVLFQAEHEDDTYSFLNHLPARWLPMFIGKWIAAATAAILLAAVLSLSVHISRLALANGDAVAQFRGNSADAVDTGIGMVEIAWGTLFSFW